jgi:methyl-accepting chemotaxis protein
MPRRITQDEILFDRSHCSERFWMPKFRRLPLASRVYLMSIAIVVAMIALAVTTWILEDQIGNSLEWVAKNRLPQVQRSSDIELNITRASMYLRHAMLARNAKERDDALAYVLERKQLIESAADALGKAMVTATGKEAYARMAPALEGFFALSGENIALIRSGDTKAAFADLADRLVPVRNTILELTRAEKDRQSKLVAEAFSDSVKQMQTVRNAVVGCAVVLAGILAGCAWYMSSIVRSLGAEPDTLKSVAQSVAAGDLGTPIDLRDNDQDSVLAALSRMRDDLVVMVRAVQSGAQRVAGASRQIAQGNADLSARTEQQASALQQTASSMEEFGQTVRANAANARGANELASESAQIATRGGEAVQQVVQTMNDINDGSRRIADITSVIDSIAFQTNILALNAAVEAARAGEQGRGFAVVATEVRLLAGRCAEAAREIKGLIQESVDRVDRGGVLVNQAGETMAHVVSSIRQVAATVAQIAGASAEQSAGVSQVGQAISQMDESTQRNAALVEESAAAADGLRRESEELVASVSRFRFA